MKAEECCKLRKGENRQESALGQTALVSVDANELNSRKTGQIVGLYFSAFEQKAKPRIEGRREGMTRGMIQG